MQGVQAADGSDDVNAGIRRLAGRAERTESKVLRWMVCSPAPPVRRAVGEARNVDSEQRAEQGHGEPSEGAQLGIAQVEVVLHGLKEAREDLWGGGGRSEGAVGGRLVGGLPFRFVSILLRHRRVQRPRLSIHVRADERGGEEGEGVGPPSLEVGQLCLGHHARRRRSLGVLSLSIDDGGRAEYAEWCGSTPLCISRTPWATLE